ncbi:MAG: NAD(P)/FAD-dependent oxidoreductase [Gammaproteobacteria bacterium]|nr:NAD(P)/FAD-dependent oxidoreductase [Gammaproteobacteria bacterium]
MALAQDKLEYLRDAIKVADLRVMVTTLYQMTGDPKWMEARFAPRLDRRIIADPDAGFPEEVQEEILAAAVAILGERSEPAIPDPTDEQMVRMMSWCMGEPVEPEYAPMFAEQVGFRSGQKEWRAGRPQSMPEHPVVIIGAGMSGIALGANLVKLGIPFVVLEKHHEVGGTWHENRYPGAAVDTPNHAYSFSFGERYPWSQYFSPQEEIIDYLIKCSNEFGVREHIRFGCTVTSATWDNENQTWRITYETDDKAEVELNAFIMVTAIGFFNKPSSQVLPGEESYQGAIFHSARWPQDLDVSDKRVAVIGTGASSMQIVPSIAPSVKNLTVYQRSAQWVRRIDHFHDKLGDAQQFLLDEFPVYRAWFRFSMFWRYCDGLLPTLRKDPNWPHPERSLNKINDRHRDQMTRFIEQELGDKHDELFDKCLPTYPPYGKRILLDHDWYKTLCRDNVELITEAVESITETGITTADKKSRDYDIIVKCLGFEPIGSAARLNIRGASGQKLVDAWDGDNPTAHLGMTVPDFPNMFILMGPNSGVGHGGSAIFLAECNVRYISDALIKMIEGGITGISVRREVHDKFVDMVDREHEQMIWTHPGMTTYYRNSRGRVHFVMPFRNVDYYTMTRHFDPDEYHVNEG